MDKAAAVWETVRRLLLVFMLAAVTGCQTVSYYSQAIRGQCHLLASRQPVRKLLDDPKTDPVLKGQFRLTLRLREFAAAALNLPTNGHYLDFVQLDRPYVVWNVHASPEFSLTAKEWTYPVVGRLKYRGYFSERAARGYADQLAAKGYDVYVEGVRAYSTLGWFKDPLCSSFIHLPEPELAELLFHELAHQRVFIRGDTDLSEAFATTVAEEGVRRCLCAAGNAAADQHYQLALQHNQQFVQLLAAARQRLESLYQAFDQIRHQSSTQTGRDLEPFFRQAKACLVQSLREDYRQMRTTWGGDHSYDAWMDHPLNNAQLNTIDTYYRWVPALHELLRQHQGDLIRFYTEVQRLSRLPQKKRQAKLAELLSASAPTLGCCPRPGPAASTDPRWDESPD